jgi:hypothetical protein
MSYTKCKFVVKEQNERLVSSAAPEGWVRPPLKRGFDHLTYSSHIEAKILV